MRVSLELSVCSPECVIALANVLSADIDAAAEDSQCMDEPDYKLVQSELNGAFNTICEYHKHIRGDMDKIVCPKFGVKI